MELQGRDMDVEAEKKSNEWNVTTGGGGNGALAEATGGSSPVRRERFLPGMVRVLLVEADDSTRQIIAALLRKCSYRVAAVSDGLKAWELLKRRPHGIELIMTEVELPSISGYALLSLIMEHEVCKNIPVIMMSSHDSISTVYKCMLRGAADFLVKPIRKNELMNLWQHVWRKQASSTGTGTGPPNESAIQKKDETENEAVSNNSSCFMLSDERNKQCIKKGSDAQSSWSKPELETEGEAEHDQSISPHRETTYQLDGNNEACSPEERQMDDDKNRESNHVLEYTTREAVDLIGAIDNHPIETHVTCSSNGVNSSPLLDLSLRNYANEVNNERSQLNHSNASPFSRYINKPVPLRSSTFPGICNEQKSHEPNSEKQSSKHIALDYTINTYGPTTGTSKQCSVAVVQTRGMEFDSLIGHAKPDSPHLPSYQASQCSESLQELENEDDQVHATSPVNNCSTNTSFCNMSQHHHDQSIGSGSNGNTSTISIINVPSECSNNGERSHAHEGSSHRSIQREAALSKFRLKRKERCFEKKVRYESRKKLAEQRPRIKGQFVRQLAVEIQLGN